MNPAVYVLAVFLAGSPSPSGDFDLGRYDTATECDLQARSVKIHHRGARLRCLKAPMTPEERQAWALLVGGRATASSPWWAAGPAAERRPGSPLGSERMAVLP